MCTMRWTENWVNDCTQRVMSSGTKSGWMQITGGLSRGLILRPVLFNIFINDLNDGGEGLVRLDDLKRSLPK